MAEDHKSNCLIHSFEAGTRFLHLEPSKGCQEAYTSARGQDPQTIPSVVLSVSQAKAKNYRERPRGQ